MGQQICTVCCGTKRLIEIACPPTCVYLTTAQRHPAAMVKRQQEQDLAVLLGALGRLSEPQLQLFFVIHAFISRFKPDGLRLTDADVADAVGALATSFETAGRGVLYEAAASSPAGEALRRELKAYLAKLAGEGSGSRFEREVSAVLRGIERGASHAAAGIGDGPANYLALVSRILQERPPDAGQAGSRIILP
ncbi:MAG TPA: hypothetical protein VMO26_09380 [Vicinamibacterales bacterium]|nr:hypothetical protein [Vicinamibacterales bacterium]